MISSLLRRSTATLLRLRPSNPPRRSTAFVLGAASALLLACVTVGACGPTNAGERPPTEGSGGSAGAGAPTGGASGSAGTAGPVDGGSMVDRAAPTGGGGAAASDSGAVRDGAFGSEKRGGSSAKVVCALGATYPDPLAGMGAITQVTAPTTPPANYFAFIEGPVWIGSVGMLFFSDNASSPDERIFQLPAGSTTPARFMEPSGSNGLAVGNADELVVADQRNHRIVRVDPVAAQVTGVVLPTGEWTPNDLIVRSDNNVYFTDLTLGFYRVSPSGVASSAMRQATRPNGIALSLDENKLFIGDPGTQTIFAFALMSDGAVDTTPVVFAKPRGATVDGFAVDCAGNLYASTQTGVEVYSPAGMLLGVVPTGESSNCTFGGPDRKTLYVTSRAVLKAVTLGVPGLPD